jgi:hypothetical protein
LTCASAGYRLRVSRDELFVIWSAARAEANMAYDAWCDDPGRMTYAVYRAAEDRADAAEVALSQSSMAALATA